MSGYAVDFDGDALKELQSLPRPAFGRALQAIIRLVGDPRPAGATNLTGVRNGMRIRVGDYRIVYVIDDSSKAVTIMRIGHRRDVYQ